MNRLEYFNFMEGKLSQLASSIELRGGLNILDKHLHSESFYLHFFRVLFDWELENLNVVKRNAAGADLVDHTNKIIIQVTATATKQKIESALRKLSTYKGYSFKFISISKDAKNLRTQTFLNPHNLTFSPAADIFDIRSLLDLIRVMGIDKMREIYEFIKKEFACDPDSGKVESNLTAIIKILSKENWSQGTSSFETVPYDVEAKILYNQLDKAKVLVDDYKIHYSRIEKIYSDFDRLGANKSLSILNGIRKEYMALGAVDSPDQCFSLIIDKVIQKIQASANYVPMPEEELALCVQILVVDAFVRCKIFKNPPGRNYARS
jgi:ribosomal protein L23